MSIEQLPNECWATIFEFMELFETLSISHKISKSLYHQFFHSPSSQYIFRILTKQLLIFEHRELSPYYLKLFYSNEGLDEKISKKMFNINFEYFFLRLGQEGNMRDGTFRYVPSDPSEFIEIYGSYQYHRIVEKAKELAKQDVERRERSCKAGARKVVDWKQIFIQNTIKGVKDVILKTFYRNQTVCDYMIQIEHLFAILEPEQRRKIMFKTLMDSFFTKFVLKISDCHGRSCEETELFEGLIEFFLKESEEFGVKDILIQGL